MGRKEKDPEAQEYAHKMADFPRDEAAISSISQPFSGSTATISNKTWKSKMSFSLDNYAFGNLALASQPTTLYPLTAFPSDRKDN